MITLNPHQHRRPTGGHHYPEMGTVLRDDDFDKLVQKVYDIRIKNGHPIGEPRKEILRYYAEAFPYMVQITEDVEPEVKSGDTPLYVRYRHWIQVAWKLPPKKTITTKEASFRWDVCKTCQFNVAQDWQQTQESTELDRRAFLMRRGVDVPDFLGFCSLHRWPLDVAVFLETPEQFSAKAKDKENEPRCWVGSLAGR